MPWPSRCHDSAFAEPLEHYFLSLVCVILMALYTQPEGTITAVSITCWAAALAFTWGHPKVCAQNWHMAPGPAQHVLWSFPVGKGWGEMTCCTGGVPGKDTHLGTPSLLILDSHRRVFSLTLLVLSLFFLFLVFVLFFPERKGGFTTTVDVINYGC